MLALRYDPCVWCSAPAVTIDEDGDDACEDCGEPLVRVVLVALYVPPEPTPPPAKRERVFIPDGEAFDGLRWLRDRHLTRPRRR